MFDYTTPFMKSELAYRTDRLHELRGPRRGRARTGRGRRALEETRR